MINRFHSAVSIFSGTGILLGCLFVLMLGSGLQGSLVSIRASDEGFSMIAISSISTSYYAGFFMGSIVIPILLKRVGYIRVYAALVAIASVAAVAYAMLVGEIYWVIMRLVSGVCFAGIFMICESWLNTQTHNDNRAKVLSLYVVVLYLGLMAGQFLLNYGDISGYFLFALGSVVISLASVPLLLTTRPAPVIEETVSSLSVKQLYKRSPLGAVATFFVNYMNGTFAGLGAIFAKNIGMSTSQIALFIAASFFGVIIFQMPIGYLSDKVDRRKVLIIISALLVVVAAAAVELDKEWLIYVSFALGALLYPMYALCIAYVNDRLEPEEILPATSALLKISGTGNMISPLITGWIMVQYGAAWFFGVLAIVAAIIVGFGLYRAAVHDIDTEHQTEFSPMGTSTTAATMTLAHESHQLEFDFGEEHRKSDKI